MRTYSSGMRARLGFAFSSSIRPDILVVDEALSVGDRKFSRKCKERVHKIMAEEDVTVLFGPIRLPWPRNSAHKASSSEKVTPNFPARSRKGVLLHVDVTRGMMRTCGITVRIQIAY